MRTCQGDQWKMNFLTKERELRAELSERKQPRKVNKPAMYYVYHSMHS